MAKRVADRDVADSENGKNTAAHQNVAGAGMEDRGDVEAASGAGRLDAPDQRGYTIRSPGQAQ